MLLILLIYLLIYSLEIFLSHAAPLDTDCNVRLLANKYLQISLSKRETYMREVMHFLSKVPKIFGLCEAEEIGIFFGFFFSREKKKKKTYIRSNKRIP